jgi:hypothetical protein
MPVTIELSRPASLHNKDIKSLVLKEPTGGAYLDHGEPRLFVQNVNGSWFWVEDKGAVKAYLDACLDHENGAAVLRLMTLPDVRKVKEALFGFFRDIAPTTSEK